MKTPPPNVEQTLRRLQDRAAMLRYFADGSARSTDAAPDPEVFSGLADALDDIAAMAQALRSSLSVEALDTAVKGLSR